MNISCRLRIILVITVDVDQWKIYVEMKSNLGRLQMRKVVTMAMSTKVNLSSRPLRLRRCRTCVRLSVILCKYRVLKIFTFSDYIIIFDIPYYDLVSWHAEFQGLTT